MQTKQQSSKRIFEDEVPETIPKRFMAIGKRMFAIFLTTRGLLEFVMLPAKHTVTAAWYTECCLPKVFQAVERLRPKSGIRGMKFHHDNAPAHTTGRTKEFLRQSGLEMIEHPHYSPGLAPCDFWLFPNIKRHLKSRRFESESELIAAFLTELSVYGYIAVKGVLMLTGSIYNIYNSNLLVHCNANIFFRELIEHSVQWIHHIRMCSGPKENILI